MLVPLAKITVPVAGTPVTFNSGNVALQPRNAVHAILVQAWYQNTGLSFVIGRYDDGTPGDPAFAPTIPLVLGVPEANRTPPVFTAALTIGGAAIIATDLQIDVGVSGDSVVIWALIL